MAKLLRSARRIGDPITVRARKVRERRPLTYRDVSPIMVNGRLLNRPQTVIYSALSELGEQFVPEFSLLGGDIIGGARLDFFLPRRNMYFEYDGPWHATQFNRARDALRDIGVKNKTGSRRVSLFESDLPQIKKVLLYHMGRLV